MNETTTERHRVILAATDFSVAAERAVEWAAELAARRHAELRLVHAVVAPATTDMLPSLAWPLVEDLLKQARLRLEQSALPLRQRVPALICEVELGAPAEVVLAAAARTRPELVVLGTRGLRGWRHALLGSTAERVIGRARCAVVAVHEGDPRLPARRLRLLAATDFSTDAEEATNAACRLLGDAVEEVVLLHAFGEPLPVPPSEAFAYPDFADAVRQSALEALEEQAARVRMIGCAARTELREGFPPEVIAAAADTLDADLVVMGTRGHGGIAHLLLGSCADRTLRLAHRPLLLLPRRAWQEAEEATAAPRPLVPAAIDPEC